MEQFEISTASLSAADAVGGRGWNRPVGTMGFPAQTDRLKPPKMMVMIDALDRASWVPLVMAWTGAWYWITP